MLQLRLRSLPRMAGALALATAAWAARPAAADDSFYGQTNLVSNIPGLAMFTDPDLVNPWGISFSATSPFWVSDNGTGLTTLYNGAGVKQGLVVTIPPPAGSPAGTVSAPTGQVFNSTTGFEVASGQAARFIFATEDGTISGWNPAVDLHNAILMVDLSASGAVYKGLALAQTADGPRLFATNFHAGTVDVFDAGFSLVASVTDPMAPAGYAPFGIREIGGKLVVTYARQDADAHDDVAGPGNGLIDILEPNALAFTRLATGRGAGGKVKQLNSPWGIAPAPASFGRFGGALLVGNFGDGRITAFDPATGRPLGQLRDARGHPIAIDGLWALAFGNGGNGSSPDVLYFTAGLNGEQDGLLGTIQAVMRHEREHEGDDD